MIVDRGKQKYSETNLSPCKCAYHKYRMICLASEQDPPQWEADGLEVGIGEIPLIFLFNELILNGFNVLMFLMFPLFFTQYCAGGKIEKNEMGGACGAYGGWERCAQGSDW